jgi:hypothetical protein
MFFNLSNSSSCFSTDLCRLEDGNLHKLVEANNCIHVKNSDILRKPKYLVFEKGSVSAMFTQSDGRFPIPSYAKYEHTLLNMKMMDDHDREKFYVF